MTDREKIIELLNEAHDAFYANFDPTKSYMGSLADCLIANGVRLERKQATSDKTSKWISVEDEKPNGWIVADPDTDYREPETYIVFVKDATLPTTAYFLDGKFVPACDGFLSGGNCDCIGFADDITHWMPLPEPPKET